MSLSSKDFVLKIFYLRCLSDPFSEQLNHYIELLVFDNIKVNHGILNKTKKLNMPKIKNYNPTPTEPQKSHFPDFWLQTSQQSSPVGTRQLSSA